MTTYIYIYMDINPSWPIIFSYKPSCHWMSMDHLPRASNPHKCDRSRAGNAAGGVFRFSDVWIGFAHWPKNWMVMCFFHGLICLICFLMIQHMVHDGLWNTNVTYFVRIQQIPCFIPFPSHRHWSWIGLSTPVHNIQGTVPYWVELGWVSSWANQI